MAKNKITLDVLANMTRKGNKRMTTNSSSNLSYGERLLIVFTGSNVEINERIQKIKELDKRVSIAFSFMAEKILDTDYIINTLNPIEVYKEEDILDLEKILADYSCMIGPNITMNTLSKLSMGMIDSLVSNLIWTFLYKGKEVYLDFVSVTNYLGFTSQNDSINKIIDNHINKVKDMGVVEITNENYLEKIVNKNNFKSIEKSNQINSNYNGVSNKYNSNSCGRENSNNYSSNIIYNSYGNKDWNDYNNIKKSSNINADKKNSKIITENDFLNRYANEKTVKFPKGTIVTPLARDKARDLRIEIIIER